MTASAGFLILQDFASTCGSSFSDECFRLCHKVLEWNLDGGVFSLKPTLSSIAMNSDEKCSCGQFRSEKWNLPKSDENSGQTPFGSVTISLVNDYTTVSWLGKTGAFASQSCQAHYLNDENLQSRALYYCDGGCCGYCVYPYWWAVFVGCIFFFLILCMFCVTCDYVENSSVPRPRVRTYVVRQYNPQPSPPPPQPTILVTEIPVAQPVTIEEANGDGWKVARQVEMV
jgi:hypothetical protein